MIYCSDLIRSQETARIIVSTEEETLHVVSGLREIDLGSWDGLEVAETKKRFPYEWDKRARYVTHYRPPGGESFADLAARVWPVFEGIVERDDARVIIVGHAGVNRVILTQVLGIPLTHLFRLQQDSGSSTLMAHTHAEWCLLALNIQSGGA